VALELTLSQSLKSGFQQILLDLFGKFLQSNALITRCGGLDVGDFVLLRFSGDGNSSSCASHVCWMVRRHITESLQNHLRFFFFWFFLSSGLSAKDA
jgi:hypothetical protein